MCDEDKTERDDNYPRQVGTLFLYWAFNATARFYDLFLSELDPQFIVSKRNPIWEKFSEAAKVAFTLTQGFEKCYCILRLWILPEMIRQKEAGQEVPKTYVADLRKLQNFQGRCEFFTKALY